MRLHFERIGYIHFFNKRYPWLSHRVGNAIVSFKKNVKFEFTHLKISNQHYSSNEILPLLEKNSPPWYYRCWVDCFQSKLTILELGIDGIANLAKILTKKDVDILDLSRCNIQHRQMISLFATLKISQTVSEIILPALFDQYELEKDHIIKRNKAIIKINPWYITPFKHFSWVKLLIGLLVGLKLAAYIGFSMTTLLLTTGTLCLISGAGEMMRTKKLVNAWERIGLVKYKKEEKRAFAVGQKANKGWLPLMKEFATARGLSACLKHPGVFYLGLADSRTKRVNRLKKKLF